MTIALTYEIALAAVVLGLAAWITAARETFAAVEGFVAYGLLLPLVWVRLGSVDVALTEAAIGGGLSSVLLLGAAARLRATEKVCGCGAPRRDRAPRRPPYFPRQSRQRSQPPCYSCPTQRRRSHRQPPRRLWPLSLRNPVTNVLMAFRAMDTLLEKVVLLLALVGVWSLAPDRLWGGHPGLRHQSDLRGVLAFLARLVPPLGIVVGIYVFWIGADYPGGAFQGGTILAAMWLLVMMAGLTDAPPVSRQWLRLMLIAGPGVFLIIGLGGLWLGNAFLAYPMAYAKPFILAIEVAMTLTIAVTLGLLMAGAPERRARP